MTQNIKDFMTYYIMSMGLILLGAVIYAAVMLDMPVVAIFLYPLPLAICLYIAGLMERYLLME